MKEIIGCANFLGTLERHKLKESKFWGNITASGRIVHHLVVTGHVLMAF